MKKNYNSWMNKTAEELAIIHDPSMANHTGGYITLSKNGKNVMLHRWIWEQLVGPIPDGYEIDHENGIRTDCRISNLRCVTQLINLRNAGKQSNNTSGITGVSRVFITKLWYWVVTWKCPLTNKKKSKYFSVKKLGEDQAKEAATVHRQMIIKDLQANHDYSVRHGL